MRYAEKAVVKSREISVKILFGRMNTTNLQTFPHEICITITGLNEICMIR